MACRLVGVKDLINGEKLVRFHKIRWIFHQKYLSKSVSLGYLILGEENLNWPLPNAGVFRSIGGWLGSDRFLLVDRVSDWVG